MTSRTSHADDCERVVHILADGPGEGYSQDDLMRLTGWSSRTVNDILCDLGRAVVCERARVQGGKKVVKYKLRGDK